MLQVDKAMQAPWGSTAPWSLRHEWCAGEGGHGFTAGGSWHVRGYPTHNGGLGEGEIVVQEVSN